jgi:hypothetical protein
MYTGLRRNDFGAFGLIPAEILQQPSCRGFPATISLVAGVEFRPQAWLTRRPLPRISYLRRKIMALLSDA